MTSAMDQIFPDNLQMHKAVYRSAKSQEVFDLVAEHLDHGSAQVMQDKALGLPSHSLRECNRCCTDLLHVLHQSPHCRSIFHIDSSLHWRRAVALTCSAAPHNAIEIVEKACMAVSFFDFPEVPEMEISMFG